MHSFYPPGRLAGAAFLLLVLWTAFGVAQSAPEERGFPSPEKLTYRVEWRMVTAGSAVVELSRNGSNWQTNLNLESAGLVSRLMHVVDAYKLLSNDRFCGINTSLDAQEGKRHKLTTMLFDNSRHKLAYSDKDLVKNQIDSQEIDIPPCTYDIFGALHALRQMKIEPGKSFTFPITNGKKIVNAKVEALSAEKININGKNYSTVRYEAFVFDNALYRRKGRLFVWMTDDPERIPVQMQFQMGFPIGNVSLELEKQESL